MSTVTDELQRAIDNAKNGFVKATVPTVEALQRVELLFKTLRQRQPEQERNDTLENHATG